MARRDPSPPTPLPTIRRYGIAVLSVAIAIGLDFFLLRHFEAILTPFLFAVAATIWYAGTGPGVLAIVLSVLSLNYFFLRPFLSFSPISYADLVYLAFCTFCALAVGWVSAVRRRAEQELRQTREELEVKVAERTADLRRSERYLAGTQRLTHTGSWAWDARSKKVLYCSEEMFRIFGLDPQEHLPTRKTFRQRVHPEDRNRVDERFARMINERVDSFDEYRVVLPDGTVKHVNSSANPVLDRNGELIEFVGATTDVTERKRAEQALRESEAKFRDFAETASDWLCEMGPDYKFTLLSENAFGSGAADRIGTACWDHALDLETEPEKWRLLQETVFSRKPFRDFVYRGMSSDGSPMYIRASGKPLFDANGEFRGYRGTCSDVTEITRAQEALRESEQSSRSAIDGIGGLVAIMAPNGELDALNRQGIEYFGRSLEEMKNWGTSDAVHPEDLPRIAEIFGRSLVTGSPFHYELRLRRFDGEYRWFDNRGVPTRDDSGRITRWYILGTDIEDRKRAEQALRESEERFRTMADTAPVLIWTTDADKLCTYVSQTWLDLTGRIFEEELGNGWADDIHPSDRDARLEAYTHCFDQRSSFTLEYRVRRHDGEYRWLLDKGTPRFASDGTFLGYVGSATDITERKRVEERLRVQHTVAQILAEAATIEEATPRILSAMGECLGWDVGVLWRVDREPEALRFVELWHKASIEIPEFERVSREFTFVPGLGLPGRVWSSLEPEYVPDVVPDENFPRGPIAEREGLHAAFGFPILLGGEVLGVIECFSREIRQPDQELLNMLATIGSQIGQFIERKRAEQALRESEARFRDYAETASDWLWEIGPDYKFTLLSENAFGSGAADRIGRTCWDHALDLETEPEKWRLVWETLDGRKPFRDFVYRGLSGNGSPMYVRASGTPVFDTNGEFRGYRGTGSDVTALIRAQEALRESERSARSAIDGIAGLVSIMTPNGELETVNRQVFEYFGRPLEWLKNWGTSDAVHPEDLPRVLEFFKRAIASGKPFNYELRLRRFDGEYRWFDTRHVPIRDDSGRIARWYLLATDIEDRTRAEASLRTVQAELVHISRVMTLGQLTASIAHEVNQPIGSARNNARAALNFLDRSPPHLDEVREALGCIVGDADRAGGIIDRIRDQIKKVPPRSDPFDLNRAIEEVIGLAQSMITENRVSVQSRLASGMAPVHGDRVQLQQVVLNLILNAVEAMSSVEAGERELLISTDHSEANGTLVAVRDSGPGIDPEHLERVFEAFYSTKSGMGMGLSICRSIIDAHGGRLWAAATKPRGAVFQFTLPSPETKPSIARLFTALESHKQTSF